MYYQLLLFIFVTTIIAGCGRPTDEDQGVELSSSTSSSTAEATALSTSKPTAGPTASPTSTATATITPQPSSTPEPTIPAFSLHETLTLEEGSSADSLADLELVWLGELGTIFLLLDDAGKALYQVAQDSQSGEWIATKFRPIQIDADGQILQWDQVLQGMMATSVPPLTESDHIILGDTFITELETYGNEGYMLLDENSEIVLVYSSDFLGWELPGKDGEIVERKGRFYVWKDEGWVPVGLDSLQIAALLEEDDIEWPLGRDPIYTKNSIVGLLSDLVIEDVQVLPNQLVRIHGLLSYLDDEGQVRQVKLPIWIEHQDTMTNHHFLEGSGGSDYSSWENHWSHEDLRRHVLKEIQYPLKDPVKVRVSFGLENDLPYLFYGLNEQLDLIIGMHPEGFGEFRISGDPANLGNETGWLIPISARWVEPDFPDMDMVKIPEDLKPLAFINYYPFWHNLPNASEFVLLEGDNELRYFVRFDESDSTWHLEFARSVDIDSNGKITFWDKLQGAFSGFSQPIDPEFLSLLEGVQIIEMRPIMGLNDDGNMSINGYQLIDSNGVPVLETASKEEDLTNWVRPAENGSSP